MLETAPLAILYALLGALFLDWKTVGVVYTIKTYRLLMLWIIVYLMEKVFLDNYLRKVFVRHGRPPNLTQLVTVCWAIEFITLLVPLMIMALLYSRFKDTRNSFLIDESMVKYIMADYLATSIVLVVVGVIIFNQIQNQNLFRYGHDGMRGIRAGSQMFLKTSAVVLAVPFYSLVE